MFAEPITTDSTLDALECRFVETEPKIHAFLEEAGRFDRLRNDVADLVARFPDPGARPPLFGIPIAVKDIFNVDGFETRAGTTLPPETFAATEAPCITALKDAGALILGKTVTAEFAYLAPGPTRNPIDHEHTPGGSSSGSTAAVAAGLVPLALGSQTVGSIIRPAAYCGVCGFKPSYDRIDKRGVVALAPRVDHVGLLTKDLDMMAVGASLLCSDWAGEPEPTLPVIGIPHEEYLDHAEDVGKAHFGMVRAFLRMHGCTVVETNALNGFDALHERHMDLCAIDAVEVHAAWRERWEKKYDPRTLKLLDQAAGIGAERSRELEVSCDRLREELHAMMDRDGIDLFIAPSATGPAPLGLGSTGNGVMNSPWTHAGMPVVGLPAGRTAEGLPLGIQLIGRFGTDETTIAQARQVQTLLHRMQ